MQFFSFVSNSRFWWLCKKLRLSTIFFEWLWIFQKHSKFKLENFSWILWLSQKIYVNQQMPVIETRNYSNISCLFSPKKISDPILSKSVPLCPTFGKNWMLVGTKIQKP